jgi:hypothetical protein
VEQHNWYLYVLLTHESPIPHTTWCLDLAGVKGKYPDWWVLGTTFLFGKDTFHYGMSAGIHEREAWLKRAACAEHPKISRQTDVGAIALQYSPCPTYR